ncbi:hypothetical protein ACQFX9_15790 [Aliinostoc sp. HNIBRCY26]|uniref:hypothetical protein n=1 Tax=Aliinostoc sp. HNIBRCY26 TaxID=3418997 RepID=UPI003D013CD7
MPVADKPKLMKNDDFLSVVKGAFPANIDDKKNKLHGYEHGVKACESSKGKYS